MFQILKGLKRYLILIIVAVVIWVGLIVASGAGWNPFPVNWDFSAPGAFGDSFGPLSALMASLAALSAFAALREQRKASTADAERAERNEDANNLRTFETTFFNLLAFFERIAAQTDIDRGTAKNSKEGKDAFAFILGQIRTHISTYGVDHRVAYDKVFERYMNDLAHYFRLLYNIINFVENSQIEDKYFYVRLLRSSLSDAELSLIALNCIYHPEGEKNMKPLVKQYCLLNNVSQSSQQFYKLRDWLPTEAFEKPDS